MKRQLLLFSPLTAYFAFAVSALEAANDPRAAPPTYEPWRKFCIEHSDCYVGAESLGLCHPSGGAVAIAMLHNQLSATFTTARTLRGTINIRIDQGDPILIPHLRCHALACTGSFGIDGEFIERLKHSQTIAIEATTADREKLSYSFSLAGFAEAYEGAGTEPRVFEAPLNELKEELRRRKDEMPPCE